MGVRNCAEIGENLQKIVTRLMANDDLVNLLYYTDKDPLSQPHLSDEEKKEEIFEELIKVIPFVPDRNDSRSTVAIAVTNGSKLDSNTEYLRIKLCVSIRVPLSSWMIKNTNLRPFLILGEIQKALEGKKINGIGKLTGGDFYLQSLTPEAGIYQQDYWIVTLE